MHALAKFGLATVLVTLAVLSNVLVTLSALSDAHAQIEGRQPEALYWQTFLVPEFGTIVEYPAGIFSVPDGKAEKGFGQRFNSADGRSVLTIYTRENEVGDIPASYLENNLRVGRSALDYERVTRSFFAISSTRRGSFSTAGAIFPPTPAGRSIASTWSIRKRKTRVGRRRDADQPIAAAARGLTERRRALKGRWETDEPLSASLPCGR